MNDRTRVAAAAAAPKTRMSNVVIAPDVDWEVDVDDGSELALLTTGVTSAVALPVLLLITANVLEFATEDDELEIVIGPEELTSWPVPQRTLVPSESVVEFVGGVVAPVDVAIANRPVQVTFGPREVVN